MNNHPRNTNSTRRLMAITAPATASNGTSSLPAEEAGWASVTDPRIKSGPTALPVGPSREAAVAAYEAAPDDVAAVRAVLELTEPAARKEFLDDYRRRTAWVRALYDRVVPR